MRMLHFMKLVKALLLSLDLFGFQLLLQLLLLVKLLQCFWILVAHGFGKWVHGYHEPVSTIRKRQLIS